MTQTLTSDWITAIGTVSVAIVALFLFYIQALTRWYNRPIVEIDFENKEPFCRWTEFSEEPPVEKHRYANIVKHVDQPQKPPLPYAYWIRIRIRNKGKSTLKDCEGKLVSVINSDKTTRHDFDPVNLHWVAFEQNTINISRGTYEYLDLVFTTVTEPNMIFINANEKEPRELL